MTIKHNREEMIDKLVGLTNDRAKLRMIIILLKDLDMLYYDPTIGDLEFKLEVVDKAILAKLRYILKLKKT